MSRKIIGILDHRKKMKCSDKIDPFWLKITG